VEKSCFVDTVVYIGSALVRPQNPPFGGLCVCKHASAYHHPHHFLQHNTLVDVSKVDKVLRAVLHESPAWCIDGGSECYTLVVSLFDSVPEYSHLSWDRFTCECLPASTGNEPPLAAVMFSLVVEDLGNESECPALARAVPHSVVDGVETHNMDRIRLVEWHSLTTLGDFVCHGNEEPGIVIVEFDDVFLHTFSTVRALAAVLERGPSECNPVPEELRVFKYVWCLLV